MSCPNIFPSFLSPGSSQYRVHGIGSDSTVVVLVSGNLHVAFLSPTFTMAEKLSFPFSRKDMAEWIITITPLRNTEPEANAIERIRKGRVNSRVPRVISQRTVKVTAGKIRTFSTYRLFRNNQ